MVALEPKSDGQFGDWGKDENENFELLKNFV